MRFEVPQGNQDTWNWDEVDLTHEVTEISSPGRYVYPLEVIPDDTEILSIHDVATIKAGAIIAIVPRSTQELYLAEIVSTKLANPLNPDEAMGEIEVRFANGETERYGYWYGENHDEEIARTPTLDEEKLWKEYHAQMASEPS